jgi:hypothetical protein
MQGHYIFFYSTIMHEIRCKYIRYAATSLNDEHKIHVHVLSPISDIQLYRPCAHGIIKFIITRLVSSVYIVAIVLQAATFSVFECQTITNNSVSVSPISVLCMCDLCSSCMITCIKKLSWSPFWGGCGMRGRML